MIHIRFIITWKWKFNINLELLTLIYNHMANRFQDEWIAWVQNANQLGVGFDSAGWVYTHDSFLSHRDRDWTEVTVGGTRVYSTLTKSRSVSLSLAQNKYSNIIFKINFDGFSWWFTCLKITLHPFLFSLLMITNHKNLRFSTTLQNSFTVNEEWKVFAPFLYNYSFSTLQPEVKAEAPEQWRERDVRPLPFDKPRTTFLTEGVESKTPQAEKKET